MSVKEENEITVKVICADNDLIKDLKAKGFKKGREFSLDDYYFIPNNLNINELTTRDILSKAVIIRYIVDNGEIIQKITFKKKNINDKGEIINQKAINCDIMDINEARNLFLELNYREIMNIKENDIIYYKDNIELALKFIKNSDTLIEFETNEIFNTVEELKRVINDLDIHIEKDNYFVKKAENELNKILKRVQ